MHFHFINNLLYVVINILYILYVTNYFCNFAYRLNFI